MYCTEIEIIRKKKLMILNTKKLVSEKEKNDYLRVKLKRKKEKK